MLRSSLGTGGDDEARQDHRAFIDTNLFVYAHDRTAGHKRELARSLISDL